MAGIYLELKLLVWCESPGGALLRSFVAHLRTFVVRVRMAASGKKFENSVPCDSGLEHRLVWVNSGHKTAAMGANGPTGSGK